MMPLFLLSLKPFLLRKVPLKVPTPINQSQVPATLARARAGPQKPAIFDQRRGSQVPATRLGARRRAGRKCLRLDPA